MAKRSEKRLEFLSDVLSTAIESCVSDWADIVAYERVDDDNDILGWRYDSVTLEPFDDGGIYTVTIDDIARGANLLCKSTINNQWVNDFRIANKTNGDDGDIDAMNCDMVIQYAIWGETVYG